MDATTHPPEMPSSFSRTTLARLPLSLVITDPHKDDNPIVYVNQAFVRATGYSSTAAVGRNCRFLQGEETDPDAVSTLRHAIDNEEEATVDILNYRADGTSFMNTLMITPIHWDDGKLAYFLGVQTEHRERDGESDRAAELGERLLELQHRIKNHLSMVVALIRLEATKEQTADSNEILARRVQALSLLYDQFASVGPDEDETVLLGSYLSRVCAATQQMIDPQAVRVNVDMAEVTAGLDQAARIGLFLSEVLNNALRHAFSSRNGGEIRVALASEGDKVHLKVADNGSGLQGAKWPQPESLGGRIITDIVERLEGDLDVHSTDSGLTVTLTVDEDALDPPDR